ncbi:MAG TPA: hypothetical protein VJ996_01355, partial [Solirubrobacteraceae bacterium]|nr:hypothetical protein [Solirubrobacteraceae bacterium]
MTGVEPWEQMNAAYLSTGLSWLHERLTPDAEAPEAAERWWESARFKDAEVAPALELLGDRFAMSRFERLVLLLVAASELDPRIAAACARADSDGRAYPTLALALAALPDPAWDVVSPHRPLRHWRLLLLDDQRADALTATRLRIDERIVSFLKGLNVIDGAVAQLLTPLAAAFAEPLPESQELTVQRMLAMLCQPPTAEPAPVIELVGVDPAVRRGLAACAAARISHQLYELRPERIPSTQDELAALLRLWERETLLLPVLLYIDVAHLRLEESATVVSTIEDLPGLVLLGCREQWPLCGRRIRVVDTARPTTEEQEGLWAAMLGDGAPLAARLACEFDFNQSVIADMAQLGSGGEQQLWN